MSEESDGDENGSEQTYTAEMRAGELYVSVEGEDADDAVESVTDLWDKALGDVSEMPEEERNQVGLK